MLSEVGGDKGYYAFLDGAGNLSESERGKRGKRGLRLVAFLGGFGLDAAHTQAWGRDSVTPRLFRPAYDADAEEKGKGIPVRRAPRPRLSILLGCTALEATKSYNPSMDVVVKVTWIYHSIRFKFENF